MHCSGASIVNFERVFFHYNFLLSVLLTLRKILPTRIFVFVRSNLPDDMV